MSTLRINLFGNFRLSQGTSPEETRVIRNVQALLALLLIQRGQLYSRDKLASLLWENCSETQAHSCLNTALWRLRKILEPKGVPSGTYLVSLPSGELGFNVRSNYWVDVIEFENIIQSIVDRTYASVTSAHVRQLEQAIALYREDLLEGFYYDWVVRERERLHLIYMEALYYLLRFYQHHREYPKAIRWGQQILFVDPLREDVHRNLMRLYMENGQRALAVRQYRNCEKILETELGIEPMAETRNAYERILGMRDKKLSLEQNEATRGETLKNVRSALEYIDRVQDNLQEVIDRLNQ